MKKKLLAALAAAVVVSAGSTTFAAGNPFVDVPRGHWAYNSIQKLANLGIIEGYGDDTYRGDRYITRYEMAQMIAKAMARLDSGAVSLSDERISSQGYDSRAALKADLDRLAAEFRDELDSLGVRVAELEKYADKVVWTGEMRYRYLKTKTGSYKPSNNPIQLRLFPTAEVNEHWKLKARMTATGNMKDDTSGDFKMTYAYAEGTYDKFQVNVGKMPLYSNVDDGMLIDDFFSGVQVTFGNKLKVALNAGRWSLTDDPASYQGGEVSYETDKYYIGAGYHHFNSDSFRALPGYKDSDDANVWTVGGNYKFTDNFTLAGAYAQNTKADTYKRSWYVAGYYKGIDRKKPGTWGADVAYRYISDNVSLAPTYDTWFGTTNKKGIDFGAAYVPLYNTRLELRYFHGKTLDTHKTTKTFFGRASWFF